MLQPTGDSSDVCAQRRRYAATLSRSAVCARVSCTLSHSIDTRWAENFAKQLRLHAVAVAFDSCCCFCSYISAGARQTNSSQMNSTAKWHSKCSQWLANSFYSVGLIVMLPFVFGLVRWSFVLAVSARQSDFPQPNVLRWPLQSLLLSVSFGVIFWCCLASIRAVAANVRPTHSQFY